MGEPLWAAWVSSRLYQTLHIEYSLRAKASSLGAVAEFNAEESNATQRLPTTIRWRRF